MRKNIFEEVNNKKVNFKSYIEKAKELQWISNKEAEGFNENIENDKLTLGVIGQMKCGKSTFLNALVFQDEILPAATTPMTASLSIITYGAEKSLEVEFYSKEDWQDLSFQAARSIEEAEGDESLKAKIKAAKELFEKSKGIQSSLPELLGTVRKDDFNQLIEYVGADGKYVSITKTVRIEYPLDYLKGVEIVDTPGFNDPIVSREERTKEFLQKADAVLMLLYAGRAFDATDKDIIFNKVGSIGVGKVLIGVNKYDLCYSNGETTSEILDNVKRELKKASEECSNSTISELILENEPLLISANMALMSKMEYDKIGANESLNFYYKKALDDFEIQNQSEMYEKSLMSEFEEAIKKIVIDSKTDILLKKPLNFIKERGEAKLRELQNLKLKLDNNISVLSKSDDELDEMESNLEKVKKRYNRRIQGFEIELYQNILKSIKNLTFDVDDNLLNTKERCYNIVNDKFVVIKSEPVRQKIFTELDRMERRLDRDFSIANDNLNLAVQNLIDKFIDELSILMEKYMKEFESEDFILLLQKHFHNDIIDIKFTDLVYSEDVDDEESLLGKVLTMYAHFVNGATLGILQGGVNAFVAKSNLVEMIDYIFSKIDISNIQESIKNSGDKLIAELKNDIEKEFLEPIEVQIKDVLSTKSDRESQLAKSKEELGDVQTKLKDLEQEHSEMGRLSCLIM